jgi:hypothetical protein
MLQRFRNIRVLHEPVLEADVERIVSEELNRQTLLVLDVQNLRRGDSQHNDSLGAGLCCTEGYAQVRAACRSVARS